MTNFQHRFLAPWRHVLVLFILTFSSILLSGYSYLTGSIETGPYQFNYPANFGNRISIPDNNPTTKQGVYLGRMLFYEKKLSANNTVSCGSCHQQDKAFTDGRPFGEGVDGVPTARNSMSLVNLLWTRRFFWDGRTASLEEQAAVPLGNPHEMGQPLEQSVRKLSQSTLYPPLFKLVFGDDAITGDRIVKAISQFERTLISCNSRYDQYLRGDYKPTAQEMNGMELFMTGPNPEAGIRGANCIHCHGGPKNIPRAFS